MPTTPSVSHPPDLMHEAVGSTPELSHRNTRFGWMLVALSLLLFAGTFAVGLVYLWAS